MFRKFTTVLYQQLLNTLPITKTANLKYSCGDLKSSTLVQNILRYELPKKPGCNKKITIVGSGKTSLPMAKTCLDREICQQICVMDLQAMKENTKSHLPLTTSPHIKATKQFSDTRNSDLIILTKDIQQHKETGKTTFKDTLDQYTNVMNNLIPNLVRYSPNTIFLIDTEKADIVSYVAWKLSRLPKNRVMSPSQLNDYFQESVQNCAPQKKEPQNSTADVAAKIIENYHRIILSTLPQVKSNEENHYKCPSNRNDFIFI